MQTSLGALLLPDPALQLFTLLIPIQFFVTNGVHRVTDRHREDL
jgi:hypothetical protein